MALEQAEKLIPEENREEYNKAKEAALQSQAGDNSVALALALENAEKFVPDEYKEQFKQIKSLATDKDVQKAFALQYAESFIPEEYKSQYEMAKKAVIDPDSVKEMLPEEYRDYYEKGKYVAEKTMEVKAKAEEMERMALQAAIDPVWNKYYPEREEIKKDEVKDLVMKALEEMKKPQYFNQTVFDLAFKQIDKDGNGDLDKSEVVDLAKIIVRAVL